MRSVPTDPTVLDTTVLSNFAYVDRMDLLIGLPHVCTVPEVRRELREGVTSHQFLQRAIDSLGGRIPVVELDALAGELIPEVERRLDPGEAQAYAIVSVNGGVLVTDDRIARGHARRHDVSVTGSIGVLISAVENSRISTVDADRCLKRWIDENDFRAPSRELSDFL